jgi:hypothetical protein
MLGRTRYGCLNMCVRLELSEKIKKNNARAIGTPWVYMMRLYLLIFCGFYAQGVRDSVLTKTK